MPEAFLFAVGGLVRKAPKIWLDEVFKSLCYQAPTASPELVMQRSPPTTNADLAFLLAQVIRLGTGHMSWEAIGWAVKAAQATSHELQAQQQVELLWSGPSPASQIPIRRIDQVFYDLIALAKREILLVTFAAAKIGRLSDSLVSAAIRGVSIRLILEFEQTSEGQLSYDALNAFPAVLRKSARVYYWPAEKRGRNEAGRPGKLHAKVAVIDNAVILSSANLTDDAFNRNLEMGVCIRGFEVRNNLLRHFEALIEQGVVVEMK
jgi:cardiolipin synthase A/B